MNIHDVTPRGRAAPSWREAAPAVGAPGPAAGEAERVGVFLGCRRAPRARVHPWCGSFPRQAPAPARCGVPAALPEDPGCLVSPVALPERADVPDAALRRLAG